MLLFNILGQAAVSQLFENHRRPLELELIPEIQPFLDIELAQTNAARPPLSINPELPPWESAAPRPDLRLDANTPGFALLMQSVTQQR